MRSNITGGRPPRDPPKKPLRNPRKPEAQESGGNPNSGHGGPEIPRPTAAGTRTHQSEDLDKADDEAKTEPDSKAPGPIRCASACAVG